MGNAAVAPARAYAWAYFTGESNGGERISLAVSRGDDALRWQTLNHGRPVLSSRYGTRGLRDPFIMRTHEGDGFVLIATDLNVSQLDGDFQRAQCIGSRHLEIWQSSDLIHFSEQRHVTVSPLEAGNTWAPEAHWVDELGMYALYWASNLYDGDQAQHPERRARPTYNRMMISLTRDFRTFSPPKVWVDVCRGDGRDGRGTIDATVVRDGDWWYRFIKDEGTMRIREERSRDLMAPVTGALPDEHETRGWRLVSDDVGVGLPNGERDDRGVPQVLTRGEGPCIVRTNPGDVNAARWLLFIDQPRYHGGPNHYIAFAGDDLADPDGWRPVSGVLRESLPVNADGGRPRHGTVLPITAAESARLLAGIPTITERNHQ